MQAADSADDPFLWLEDIRGEKALDWVKQQNAVSLKQLKADPEYQAVYDSILAILDADDRIPGAQLHADRLKIDLEKAKTWLGKGATPSDRVHRFLADAGVLKHVQHHNPEKMKPKKKAQERAAAAAKAAAAAGTASA